MGAELDQGLLENQVLCNVHIQVIAMSMMTAGTQQAHHCLAVSLRLLRFRLSICQCALSIIKTMHSKVVYLATTSKQTTTG